MKAAMTEEAAGKKQEKKPKAKKVAQSDAGQESNGKKADKGGQDAERSLSEEVR